MLREILLTNYRIYNGVTCISVATPPLPAITTISAGAGSGKTTILDAIHWCLFGKGIIERENVCCINREVYDKLDNGIATIAAVSLTFEHNDTTIQLRREQWFRKVDFQPRVEQEKLYIDDNEVSTPIFQATISSIISLSQIDSFFITDKILEHHGNQSILDNIHELVTRRSNTTEKTDFKTDAEDIQAMLLRQPEVRNFFDVIVPEAIHKNVAIGHTLLICPNPKIADGFTELMKAALLNRAVKLVSDNQKMAMGDIWASFTNLNEADVCIQRITTLPTDRDSIKHIESALTEFYTNIQIGKGPGSREIRLDLPPFTFVAVATKMSDVQSAYLPLFENIIEVKPTPTLSSAERANRMYSKIVDDANACLHKIRFDDCSIVFEDSSFRLETVEDINHEGIGSTTDLLTLNLSLLFAYQKMLNDGTTDQNAFPILFDDIWTPAIDRSKFNFEGFISTRYAQQLVFCVFENNEIEHLLHQSRHIGLSHRIFKGSYVSQ